MDSLLCDLMDPPVNDSSIAETFDFLLNNEGDFPRDQLVVDARSTAYDSISAFQEKVLLICSAFAHLQGTADPVSVFLLPESSTNLAIRHITRDLLICCHLCFASLPFPVRLAQIRPLSVTPSGANFLPSCLPMVARHCPLCPQALAGRLCMSGIDRT